MVTGSKEPHEGENTMQAQASILTSSYAGTLLEPAARETEALAGQMDSESAFDAGAPRCARGFLFAIGLEAAAALCIYGIWLVCHVIA
jgi:poly-gamma-glutamate capsule biosynthesis protein CapA/YwtB (metallophosphatase superfamily)